MVQPTPPSDVPLAPPGTPQQWVPPAAPPKKNRNTTWIIVGVVVAVLAAAVVVVVGLGLFVVQSVSNRVIVTGIDITSHDNACNLDGQSLTGFTTTSGSRVQETVMVTNGDPLLSCTISRVAATTSGFSVSGANVPLTILAQTTHDLSLNITAPGGAFIGVLTIEVE